MHSKRRVVLSVVAVVALGVVAFVWWLGRPTPLKAAYDDLALGTAEADMVRLFDDLPLHWSECGGFEEWDAHWRHAGKARHSHGTALDDPIDRTILDELGLVERRPSLWGDEYLERATGDVYRSHRWSDGPDRVEVIAGPKGVLAKYHFRWRRESGWDRVRQYVKDHSPF
jgi:hypothetical protein